MGALDTHKPILAMFIGLPSWFSYLHKDLRLSWTSAQLIKVSALCLAFTITVPREYVPQELAEVLFLSRYSTSNPDPTMVPLPFSDHWVWPTLIPTQAQVNPRVTAHIGLCPLGISPTLRLVFYRPSLHCRLASVYPRLLSWMNPWPWASFFKKYVERKWGIFL